MEKVRGRKQSLNQLVEKMKSKNPPVWRILFSLSATEIVKKMQKCFRVSEKECGIKKYMIHDIGPVIGAHSGPGTVALFFSLDKAEPNNRYNLSLPQTRPLKRIFLQQAGFIILLCFSFIVIEFIDQILIFCDRCRQAQNRFRHLYWYDIPLQLPLSVP